jgi:hypothetical protein
MLVRELTNLRDVLAGMSDRLRNAEVPTVEHSDNPVVKLVNLSPSVPTHDNTIMPVATGWHARCEGVLLKVLLRERHWQTYRTFCREYDKAAATVDSYLVGSWPSRAQLHRWTSGHLKGLPYPDHCRVLEAMFPGHLAEQLFQPVPLASPVTRLRAVV